LCYELAQVKAALALKDVAIYEPPPPPVRVRVCEFVCARTDSVSRPECGGGGGVGRRWWWYHTAGPRALQVPPPSAARSVHLCAGIVTMAGTATGPRPGSAQPYSCLCLVPACNLRIAAIRPGPSPKGFSTHMGARVVQQVGIKAAPRSTANAPTVALKWERARFVQ